MTLNSYQQAAIRFAKYPERYTIVYPALGLNGEAGEVAEKIKKALRDDEGIISQERVDGIINEMGDVLWYLAALARDLGTDLETVARLNIKKLTSRAERGVLGGSGDNR